MKRAFAMRLPRVISFTIPWRRALVISLLIVLSAPARVTAALRTITTRHYRLHTDLDADLGEDLSRRMDAMYEEYARRLADFKSSSDLTRLEVYLFRNQEDYLQTTGDRLRNTGGVYIPRRNLLAAFLEGQGRDGLRRTLQHEAFHQFAYNVISPDLPVWLNEGMAQLFEEAIWTGDSFWLGQVPPRRVRQLQADLQKHRFVDFTTLMSMSQDQWASNLSGDGDVGATQYNQSWAMVHFLCYVKDTEGREKHRLRLIQMLRLMHEGKDPDAAFREAFSANVKGFQDRFAEYARELKPSDEATLIERQSVLGDLLSELNKRGRKFLNLSQFKRAALAGGYRMHYTKGELQWESDPDLRIYFADMAGRALASEELFFDAQSSAALPDIICRPSEKFQLRTRFYDSGDKFEHEILLEPPAAMVRAQPVSPNLPLVRSLPPLTLAPGAERKHEEVRIRPR